MFRTHFEQGRVHKMIFCLTSATDTAWPVRRVGSLRADNGHYRILMPLDSYQVSRTRSPGLKACRYNQCRSPGRTDQTSLARFRFLNPPISQDREEQQVLPTIANEAKGSAAPLASPATLRQVIATCWLCSIEKMMQMQGRERQGEGESSQQKQWRLHSLYSSRSCIPFTRSAERGITNYMAIGIATTISYVSGTFAEGNLQGSPRSGPPVMYTGDGISHCDHISLCKLLAPYAIICHSRVNSP